jgi:hypothetical protein
MSRISIHIAPDKDAIANNVAKEPQGERIRAELIDFLVRNKIVSMMLDTDHHVIGIDIVKLPPNIKPVLTHWGSIFVCDDGESEPAAPAQVTFEPVKMYPIPGTRGDGWTSDPPAPQP